MIPTIISKSLILPPKQERRKCQLLKWQRPFDDQQILHHTEGGEGRICGHANSRKIEHIRPYLVGMLLEVFAGIVVFA